MQDEQVLSQEFQSYWASFARTNDPNQGSPKVTAWPLFSAADGAINQLDVGEIFVSSSSRTKFCDFWDTTTVYV